MSLAGHPRPSGRVSGRRDCHVCHVSGRRDCTCSSAVTCPSVASTRRVPWRARRASHQRQCPASALDPPPPYRPSLLCRRAGAPPRPRREAGPCRAAPGTLSALPPRALPLWAICIAERQALGPSSLSRYSERPSAKTRASKGRRRPGSWRPVELSEHGGGEGEGVSEGRPPWVGNDQGGEEAVGQGGERLAFGSTY